MLAVMLVVQAYLARWAARAMALDAVRWATTRDGCPCVRWREGERADQRATACL